MCTVSNAAGTVVTPNPNHSSDTWSLSLDHMCASEARLTSAPDRPERSVNDASDNGVDWDADVLPKMCARKALQRPAGRSDGGGHPEDFALRRRTCLC